MLNQPKLAVLASSRGSNFEVICKHLKVSLLITDGICGALGVARDHRILNLTIKRAKENFDREDFTRKILVALQCMDIRVVAMAGFMTILHPCIFREYKGVILNLHPSLLPDFKGAHAVRDALASGRQVTGCTVHIATAELDAGLILAQRRVPVLDGDTEETLHARIKEEEHKLYPGIIKNMLEGFRPFVHP